MRPQIVTILTFLLFLMNSITLLGQSSTASSGPPPPPQRTPPELPIDSSIYLLVIAGIIYGVYVVLQKKKATDRLP